MRGQNSETNCREPNIDCDYNEESIRLESTSMPSPNMNIVKHTMDILKAALPYADVKSLPTLQIMVKATELMDTIKSQAFELSTLDLDEGKGDMEGMLNSIRELCTDRERELIDIILNIINAKNLYNTYKTISSMGFNNSDNTEGNPFAGAFGFGDDSSMMDILSSMLSPEQQSTFETLNTILSTMPDSTT